MRSLSNAWRRAVVDNSTGALHVYGFIRSLFIPNEQLRGFFENAEGGILSLYRDGEKLMLQFDKQRIEIDKETTAKLISEKPKPRLQVYKQNAIVLDVAYTPDTASIIPGDITAFTFDEDFDFGIFCENVINDPERQKGIFRQGM